MEKRGRASARMAVIPDFKSTTLIAFLKQNVEAGSAVYTDGLKSFTGLPEAGFQHVSRSQPLRTDLRQARSRWCLWQTAQSENLQQWLIGTYHGGSRDQLPVYLDEFAFRHNRRSQPRAAFQTLLGLGTGRKPTTYKQIRCAVDLSTRPTRPDPKLLRIAETMALMRGRLPLHSSTNPRSQRRGIASRTVARLTPSRAASALSGGRSSPALSLP